MTKKNKTVLNANDYFSKAAEEAVGVIERALAQHGCPAGFNTLIFFSCLFLRLILARVDIKKQNIVTHHLREVLKMSADDGVTMCSTIRAAKIETQEDRDQALAHLVENMDGVDIPAGHLFHDVAKYTHSLGMTKDSLWKVDEFSTYSASLGDEVESQLNELIDEKINTVIRMGMRVDFGCPQLNFFVSASISTGLMLGYASVLYHQSLDEMIDSAIKQITAILPSKNSEGISKLKFSQLN